MLACLDINTYTSDIDVIPLPKNPSYGPAKSSSVKVIACCCACRIALETISGCLNLQIQFSWDWGELVEMPYKSCSPPPNKIASYAYACTVNNHDCTHYLLISPAADLMNIHISFSCRVHYEEQCYSFVCPSTPEGNLTMQLQVLVNTTYVISIYYLNMIIKWLNRYNLNCIHYKLNLTKQESL